MPPYQLPYDNLGPPNSRSAHLIEPDSSITDTDTDIDTASTTAVATALPAASVSLNANSALSHCHPLSHLKTSSLSPTSRPPRTSSLLPPPRALQRAQFENNHSIENVDAEFAADNYRYQHTSAAAHGDPPSRNTSPDSDDPSDSRHPTYNQRHPAPAHPPHGRLNNTVSQNDPTSLHPAAAENPQAAPSWPDSNPATASQLSHLQPASAPTFVPLPAFELLPPLDKNFGEPFTSIVDTQQPGRHMPQNLISSGQPARGHGRRRSSRGSSDAERSKMTKPPSQKAMLSRALQKANTAVQLDNAQNLEGARLAYSEACDLLEQVLRRTSADEDKRKLEAIRQTYASRIAELDQIGPIQEQDWSSKALPARPGSDDYSPESPQQQYGSQSIASTVVSSDASKWSEGHTANRNYPRRPNSPPPQTQQPDNDQPPPNVRATEWHKAVPDGQPGILQSSFSKPTARSNHTLTASQERTLNMPQPLHSNRAPSPLKNPASQYVSQGYSRRTSSKDKIGHARDGSQNSWLDAVGESGGSTASSTHSRTSSQGYRRKHLRGMSGNTEAEFDTALDAAIEAAYDDGYEPMGTDELGGRDPSDEAVAKVLRKVEIARERVRQTEQETLSNGTDMASLLSPRIYKQPNAQNGFYDENSSDDEERMLEEMARDYDIGDFTMSEAVPIIVTRDEERRPPVRPVEVPVEARPQPEATRPLMEKKSISNIIKGLGPSLPPPNTSLPELPPPRGTPSLQSVRNRRLSGQNPKQLKIDTTKPSTSPLTIHSHSNQSKGGIEQENERPSTAAGLIHTVSHVRSTPSVDLTPSDPSVLVSPGGHRVVADPDEATSAKPISPTASSNKLRKNFSSSSLRSMKSRNMSLSNLEDPSDMSPSTPSSNQFGVSRTPVVPTVPTPMSSEFRDNLDSSSAGARLFDDHFHQPTSPGSADNAHPDAPVPLEPCPNDFMLRPFWLMRCIFQTLVHPRGGYVSTKLFVPRDVWKVKGVKLKNVDDKIANCDLLTAALLKLAQVDTFDADAVLEEMQSLEGILEQVQASLTRKLGSEVGIQGSGTLFKEAGGDGDGAAGVPRSGSVSTKPAFSWRRLRSKSSGVALGNTYNGARTAVADIGRGDTSMPSLPMTVQPTSRPPRRDLALAQFSGPNANYMSSLARLFDAAQAVDQIARQVEDPGLRHADKTQVGLELCTRHAAEFFGFYVCRFALTDLGLLLEKFIKRGSEWVLA